jgi:hypothetical protein
MGIAQHYIAGWIPIAIVLDPSVLLAAFLTTDDPARQATAAVPVWAALFCGRMREELEIVLEDGF